MENKSGPRINPWGTPQLRGAELDKNTKIDCQIYNWQTWLTEEPLFEFSNHVHTILWLLYQTPLWVQTTQGLQSLYNQRLLNLLWSYKQFHFQFISPQNIPQKFEDYQGILLQYSVEH